MMTTRPVTRRSRHVPQALILTALTVGFGSLMQAYVLDGHKWGTSVISYYVNPHNKWVSESAAVNAIQLAASSWHDQSNANIQLAYAGTTTGSSLVMNGKNEVFFRDGSNGSLVGESYYWWDGSGRLVEGDTVFYEGTYRFFAGSGCVSGIYIEDVAIHEFGHILGLRHSDVAGATMEPSMPTYCDTTQLTLEPDDIAGVRALYPPLAGNSAPSVSISGPANNTTYGDVTPIAFAGSASDSQDGNLNSRLVWTSNISGQIGTGASFTRTLPAGTHVVTASVTDTGGLAASQQTTITIVASAPAANTAPSVAISTPASNTTYGDVTPITFAGSASDSQDGTLGSRLVWTSNISGQIGTGATFTRTLPAGTHVITTSVTDSGGLVSSQQVTITVVASAPAPGGATLTANNYMVNGVMRVDLTWSGFTSSFVGIYRNEALIGYGNTNGTSWDILYSQGSYAYTICAGTRCSNTVTVQYGSNTAPSISLSAPAGSSSFAEGTSITFTGSATDSLDGNLTSRLQWTSSLAGPIGTGGSFSRSLSAGVHVITASVIDSGGLVSSQQVTITVLASVPAPSGPTLTANSYMVNGVRRVDLAWSGFAGPFVGIYRNQALIGYGDRGVGTAWDILYSRGSYAYTICAGGTCSNTITVQY